MTDLTLDSLLVPYETLPPAISPLERERRASGMDFGLHLNRIQGLDPDQASTRLVDLYVSGRIEADEYRRLAVTIARHNLDAPAPG